MRYLQDDNGPTSAPKLDCLQRKLRTSNDILESHIYGKRNIQICVKEDIILGPMKLSYINNGKHRVAGYNKTRKLFAIIKKLDGVDIQRKYICECFKE